MFTHCHSVANTKAFARSPTEGIKRFLNDRIVFSTNRFSSSSNSEKHPADAHGLHRRLQGDEDNCRSWRRIVWQYTNLAETCAASFIRVAKECVMFMHIVARYTCTGLQDDLKQTDLRLLYRISRQWISGAIASATSHIRATAILVLSVVRSYEIYVWGCPQ
jgi:hypothetical protein